MRCWCPADGGGRWILAESFFQRTSVAAKGPGEVTAARQVCPGDALPCCSIANRDQYQ